MIREAEERYLVWALLVAYLAHLGEEWYGGEGLPCWMSRTLGAALSRRDFLAINGVAVVCVIAGASAFHVAGRRLGIVPTTLGTVFLVNGLLHLSGSLLSRSYSPGLFTGVVVYVPCGIMVLRWAKSSLSAGQLMAGVLFGLGLHGLVFALAMQV